MSDIAGRPKASQLITDIIVAAEKILARPFSDLVMAAELAKLSERLDAMRNSIGLGARLVGNTEEIQLMALAQVAGGDHALDIRKKWASIASVILEHMQRPQLLTAITAESREQRVGTSDNAEMYQRGQA